MAASPLTFLEQRWAAGYSANNSLVRSATQTTDRQQISGLDYDTHRTISPLGHSVLRMIGRHLYWNCDPIRAAVDEMARLATSTFFPQFYGTEKEWGREAESYLRESDNFIDVRGWPFTWSTYLQNLVREVLVDGDQGTLLAELNDSARVQVWKSHRIGSRAQSNIVSGGPYDGATIINGCILNDYGGSYAYAIQPDANYAAQPMAYVSANNFLLNFLPSTSDALRGYSALATAAFPMSDREESKAYLLLAQKIAATMAVEIQNQAGQPDRAKALVSAPATAAEAGVAQELPKELMKPGRIMYFAGGKGQGIKVVEQDQPGDNVVNYQNEIIREGLQSLGWSYDFSHNPSKVGGAQMRVVIEKIEARLHEIRAMLVGPVARRITGYRIAKAIKAGFLRENSEWFMWRFQWPAKLTADRKYDSEIDLEESLRGLMTDQKFCGRRGDDRDEVYEEVFTEGDRKLEMAKKLSGKYGVTIQEAHDMLWKRNPNAPAAVAEPYDAEKYEKENAAQ